MYLLVRQKELPYLVNLCIFVILFLGGTLSKHSYKSVSDSQVDVCELERKTPFLLRVHGKECLNIKTKIATNF